MHSPTLQEFQELAREGDTIPVYREFHADLLTPVGAFLALDEGTEAFLLESVEGGEKWGRHSFVGTRPHEVITIRGTQVSIRDARGTRTEEAADPIEWLNAHVAAQRGVHAPGLPRFHGGLVGFLGYDMVRHIEAIPSSPTSPDDPPDAMFVLTDGVVIFDNLRQSVFVCAHARVSEHESVERAWSQTCEKVDALMERLMKPIPHSAALPIPTQTDADLTTLVESLSDAEFEAAVDRAREYVAAGDVIQVVLSRAMDTPALGVDPFGVYRMLRAINPSPHLYFLRLGDMAIAGSSPEILVRYSDDQVEVRPIAGTRRRGANEEEDRAIAEELRTDAKEVAEHIMLLDLGRNDIGRIARPGTVKVTEEMSVERYSHVMHLVSSVRGEIQEGLNANDVFRATFPAGTLSGAPKIRAMEIIAEMEPTRRGVYGGAIGHLGFDGSMDLCIAIRTLVARGDTFRVQAGAGIVYDSVPEKEAEETRIKARAVLQAIAMAQAVFGCSEDDA
jgi:anthranilate synthase component 1